MNSLLLHFPEVPPTENKIRIHRWQGGETYSVEAKNYSKRFTSHVGRENQVEIQKFLSHHTPQSAYSVEVILYFKKWELLNQGWFERWARSTKESTILGWDKREAEEKVNPSKKKWRRPVAHVAGERKAKTLHKVLDTGNRNKLLIDCLVKAIGIDDSVFYGLSLRKTISTETGVAILIERVDPQQYGVPKECLAV